MTKLSERKIISEKVKERLHKNLPGYLEDVKNLKRYVEYMSLQLNSIHEKVKWLETMVYKLKNSLDTISNHLIDKAVKENDN